MKRYCVLLCILTILLSTCVVHAETTMDKPILFRGNQWGASLPEVLKSLPADVRFYSISSDSAYQVEYSLFGESRQYFDGHVCGYTSAVSSSLENMTVAGYEVAGIYLRFAWVPGDDGLIVEEDVNTALYYAEYKIEPRDPEAVLADLTAKLISIYGEADLTKIDGSIIKEKYTIWYGDADTVVALVGREYSSGSYDIEIRYGTLDGNEMLQTAYEALILQERLNMTTSVDGL